MLSSGELMLCQLLHRGQRPFPTHLLPLLSVFGGDRGARRSNRKSLSIIKMAQSSGTFKKTDSVFLGYQDTSLNAKTHFSRSYRRSTLGQFFRGHLKLVQSIDMTTGSVTSHTFHTRCSRSWQFQTWANRTSHSDHSWPHVSCVAEGTQALAFRTNT